MTKLFVAVAMFLLFLPASYPMGVFHRHHDDPASTPPPSNVQTSNFSGSSDYSVFTLGTGTLSGMMHAVPEPETYLLMLVGIGAVAWVVRKRNKRK